MKVLLTGGTGYLGASCIDALLQHNHTVTFTARSKSKAEKILASRPNTRNLSYSIVEDITNSNAFDATLQSDPPFEAVIHTASPYHFTWTDAQTQMYNPVVHGTTNLLHSIKNHAPPVKRVVLTSSFATMVNVPSPPNIYDGTTWNPITLHETLHTDKFSAWRGSKTFAEKAAWEFIETEKPKFTLTCINPPLMFGPLRQPLDSRDDVNQSVQRIRDMVAGKMKDGLAPTGIFIWVDVRDVAEAHVLAIERPEAAGQRVLCTEGFYTNADIADTIKKRFPELEQRLPERYERDIDDARKPFEIDNAWSREVLGLKYRSLEESITDTVESLEQIGR